MQRCLFKFPSVPSHTFFKAIHIRLIHFLLISFHLSHIMIQVQLLYFTLLKLRREFFKCCSRMLTYFPSSLSLLARSSDYYSGRTVLLSFFLPSLFVSFAPSYLLHVFSFLRLYDMNSVMLQVTRRRVRSRGKTGSTPIPIPRTCQSMYTGNHWRPIARAVPPNPSFLQIVYLVHFPHIHLLRPSLLAHPSSGTLLWGSALPPRLEKSPFYLMRTIRLCNMTHVFSIATISFNSQHLNSRRSIWNLDFITPNNRSTSFRTASWFLLNVLLFQARLMLDRF